MLKAGLFGGLLNGCVIFLILGVALGLGLWLDRSTDSGKHVFTFGFILVSIPVTFVVVYFLGRWLSSRMAPPKVDIEPELDDFLEDDDRGND